MHDAARLSRGLRLATGALLVVLPVVRMLGGGPGWDAAMAAGSPMLVAVDIGVALAGFAFLITLRGQRAPHRVPAPMLQAAE